MKTQLKLRNIVSVPVPKKPIIRVEMSHQLKDYVGILVPGGEIKCGEIFHQTIHPDPVIGSFTVEILHAMTIGHEPFPHNMDVGKSGDFVLIDLVFSVEHSVYTLLEFPEQLFANNCYDRFFYNVSYTESTDTWVIGVTML